MTVGGNIGPFITENATEGEIGYAWANACSNSRQCTKSVYTADGWVSVDVADSSYCPAIDTDDCQGGTYEPGSGTGLKGGLFPWGFANILPASVSDPIKKLLDALLLVAIAAVGLYLLSKFLKK